MTGAVLVGEVPIPPSPAHTSEAATEARRRGKARWQHWPTECEFAKLRYLAPAARISLEICALFVVEVVFVECVCVCVCTF